MNLTKGQPVVVDPSRRVGITGKPAWDYAGPAFYQGTDEFTVQITYPVEIHPNIPAGTMYTVFPEWIIPEAIIEEDPDGLEKA